MHTRRRWRALALTLLLLSFGLLPQRPVLAEHTPEPETVTIPGTLQSQLGCSGDWQPDCDKTFLRFEEGVWQGRFALAAGEYEYKAAINQSWNENYGLNAQAGGANIPLALAEPATVLFLYDHQTHLVVDSVNTLIPTLVGSFQDELGCASDDDLSCLAGWLQDSNNDGTFTFVTTALPAGTYEARVTLNQNDLLNADDAPATFTVAQDNAEIYFAFNPDTQALVINTEGAPKGNLGALAAHWVSREFILWNVLGSPQYSYELHYSPEGALELGAQGISGGTMVPLEYARSGPGAAVFEAFPHLAGFTTLRLPDAALDAVPEMLRSQVAVLVRNEQGQVVDSSGLQIPGALDAVYQYAGPLGVSVDTGVPTLRVWAPTARQVNLLRYADALTATAPLSAPMTLDPATGVWSITGAADWLEQFYVYEVAVWTPSTGQIEVNQVTDPYSFSLSANSTRSQIVDLDAAALKPANWDTLSKPALDSFNDIVLYELHIRDFSITDASVPEALRGTFGAFGVADSAGMRHLRQLAEAGVSHVHLLPAFDIATIEENRAAQTNPDFASLDGLPSDSEEQQALLEPTRDQDGFNWGYDPLHYTVPEGSYSSDPNGPARILEFRAMVQDLNASGLRVVMDVVYNHTNAAGQSPRAILDRIVPGYYHRLNGTGGVENSTCCANTATEHAMMEKLMINSVVTWAKAYKVDGFRFDLMGHHMRADMEHLRAALDALTPEQDGVDGSKIYVYGEGWNFGEVADNARGLNATQLNMGGSGIGSFNDRLRDAVRGGGPFSGFQDQGFATGLFSAPNATDQGSADEQQAQLLLYADHIRLGLAGNLADYTLTDRRGKVQPGNQIQYNGQPTGYTASPSENIVYVSAHDNETLFDAIQAKAPAAADLDTRVRMNTLALSFVALAQGVPFFHAGDELLRSKSLDRNSYNSGDWFNAIDWTGERSTWGVGLPPAGDNRNKWPLIQPLLADPALKPQPAQIAAAQAQFLELLQIRRSSPLFRMASAAEISKNLRFLNTGPEQVPGLIVMQLSDNDDRDPTWDTLVVLFNGQAEAVSFSSPELSGEYALHPVQAASADPVVRTATWSDTSFTVPAYTTAVFVQAASTEAATPEAPTQTPPANEPPATASPTPAAPLDQATYPGWPIWLATGAVLVVAVGLALRWLSKRKTT